MAEETKPAAAPAAPIVPKMVTWQGEDDAHFINQVAEDGTVEKVETSGPSFCTWNGIRFDKDKPKLIDPEQATTPEERNQMIHILAKLAKVKTRFKLEDVKGAKQEAKPAEEEVYDDSDEDDEEIETASRSSTHKRGKRR